MDKQEFLNAIYDLIAQNPISGAYGMSGDEHNHLTELVDYVDTERFEIVFRNKKGKEFSLVYRDNYAPSSTVAKE